MKFIVFSITLILACSCSMQKMMSKRMTKMNNEDKKLMMSKMMSCFDSTSCTDMMAIFFSNTSNNFRIQSRALQMMPNCYENILVNLDEEEQLNFSIRYTEKIILKSTNLLEDQNKNIFIQNIKHTFDSLDTRK